MTRRSFWAWGLESDEPSLADRQKEAARLSREHRVHLKARPAPVADDLNLRKPRIKPPGTIARFCSTDAHDRAFHSYGSGFRARVRAFNGDFPNPTDVVAYPRNEAEIEATLEWCDSNGYVVVPFGGGSTVVGGVEPPEESDGIVTIDLSKLDQILEIDDVSRAARIQAGIFGPALEDGLCPHGFTLRHFPQSFEYSTLGDWIVTRSGGHYATNHTHIDDFVESIRMVTPRGVWESRRLPGSGAGPSPDRFVLGSEGILGVVTEAWMRIQARPVFRASAGVRFLSFEAGAEAARRVVQAKLWPANCRLLDPGEAAHAAGSDGGTALLILGFESAEIPQGPFVAEAIGIARDAGGSIDDDEVRVSDGSDRVMGRQGGVGAWRNAFIGAPYHGNLTAGLGLVGDTFETSITWERWPDFDTAVRTALEDTVDRVLGNGRVTCRFTHVYTDGPAPYFTVSGVGKPGSEIEMHAEIKAAASDAIMEAGGTITHHHAVGRLHRPWYDRQRPPLFTEALRAAKGAVDPNGILNPGVLIDP